MKIIKNHYPFPSPFKGTPSFPSPFKGTPSFPSPFKSTPSFPSPFKGRLGGVIKQTILITLFTIIHIIPAKSQPLPDFTSLVEELMPTAVNITIDLEEGSSKVSSGSGFIISEDGYVVTNKHVIDYATSIKVITNDNKSYPAEIIGIDNKTDLSLLKISPFDPLKAVKFGNSDNIKVGEWIFAIGNPFGLGNSVTKGIISAKSRDIDSGNYDDFIQTDAAINRGNSGGPMFNLAGELIGINTSIFSTTGTSMGIGFAIPSNQAAWVIDQLKKHGKVQRAWIGIGIRSHKTNDIIVSTVSENSPAQKAGIKVGDIILKVGEVTNISNARNLSRIIAETPIGDKLSFTISRVGKTSDILVSVEEMPAPAPERALMKSIIESNLTPIPSLGFSITESSHGLVISNVDPSSDAANKGIITGDVIVKIDGKGTFTAEDIKNFTAEAKMEEGRPVEVQIMSDGTSHFVTLEVK